jgi:hypothetical protein
MAAVPWPVPVRFMYLGCQMTITGLIRGCLGIAHWARRAWLSFKAALRDNSLEGERRRMCRQTMNDMLTEDIDDLFQALESYLMHDEGFFDLVREAIRTTSRVPLHVLVPDLDYARLLTGESGLAVKSKRRKTRPSDREPFLTRWSKKRLTKKQLVLVLIAVIVLFALVIVVASLVFRSTGHYVPPPVGSHG